eukprot:4849335-Prymnesium_polylepis.2
MPVLPDVKSTSVVTPGLILPSFSAASIMLSAIRSLSEPPGFCISSLTSTRAACAHSPRARAREYQRGASRRLGNVGRRSERPRVRCRGGRVSARLGVDGEALLEGDHRRLADGAQVVDDGRRRHLARLARQDLRHARHRIGSLLAHDLADGRRDLLLEVLWRESARGGCIER